MGKRPIPCTFCRETKRKCDLQQPCNNCMKAKTPRVCEYPHKKPLVPTNPVLGSLVRIGYACRDDLVPSLPIHITERSIELDEALEFASCFFSSTIPFSDRFEKAASLPCSVMNTIRAEAFGSLQHAMDCVRALHIYGLVYFFSVYVTTAESFAHLGHKQTITDPIFCLKKAVEITRKYLLQPTTYGESTQRVNLSDAVPVPNPYSSWVDFQTVSFPERGERLLLIALVFKTDVYAALVDSERFSIDEWEIVETMYRPVDIPHVKRQVGIGDSMWLGTVYESTLDVIINGAETIDAITLAQIQIRQAMLLRKAVVYSRKQKYSQVSNLNLQSEQEELHNQLLEEICNHSLFVLTSTGFQLAPTPVTGSNFPTSLYLLTMLTTVHFDTINDTHGFLWINGTLFTSQDILFFAFNAMADLLACVSSHHEEVPCPFICDTFAFTDISLIATTTLAAFATSQFTMGERCLLIASRCQSEIIPTPAKMDVVFQGASKMFDKCQLLVNTLFHLN